MKKFVRCLALMLALTFAIGLVPAAAAEEVPELTKKSKILYVGGSKGTKRDGTKCKVTYYKSVAKMIKGFDSTVMKLKAVSADTDAVTVKGSLIKAAGIGKSEVTVTVTEKATGKILLNDVLKVTVRKNADTVTVAGDIADGDTVTVGEEYTVSLPRYIDGVKTDTDVRTLTCGNADVIITPDAEKDRVWTVKFDKAGEYTLNASAYQSGSFKGTTASTTVNVKAVLPAAEDTKEELPDGYVLSSRRGETVVHALDTNFTQSTEAEPVEFTVRAYNEGYFAGELVCGRDYYFLSKEDIKNVRRITSGAIDGSCLDGMLSYNAGSDTFTGLFFTVDAPLEDIDDARILLDDNYRRLTPIKGRAGAAAVKTAPGTYTWTLYQIVVTEKSAGCMTLGSTDVVVTDNQTMPSLYLVTDTYPTGAHGNLNRIAMNCLELTFEDTRSKLNDKPLYYYGAVYASDAPHGDITVSSDKAVVSDNNSTYLREVKIRIDNPNLGYYELAVPVNILLNGSGK